MSFEDAFLNRIDTKRSSFEAERRSENREDTASLVRAIVPQEYASASKYLSDATLNIGAFRDVYGFENIGRDMQRVKHLQSVFDEEGKKHFCDGVTFAEVKKLSEITESFILRGINESNWFPYCNAIKTPPYDDFEKGVDIVLEFQKGEDPASHIGLGVDVTFSVSLESKLEKIKLDIDDDSLADLKYFDSPKHHTKKGHLKVPRCVVGLDKNTITRLANQRHTTGFLSKHDPARLIMLRQLDLQFTTFIEYAKEIGSDSLPALERSSKFVRLLYTYVYQNTENQSSILSGNPQIDNMSRVLSRFSKL